MNEYDGDVKAGVPGVDFPLPVVDPTICPDCGKQCASPHGVSIHRFRKHGVRMYPERPSKAKVKPSNVCPECSIRFTNPRGMAIHRSTAHGVRGAQSKYNRVITNKHECPQCGKECEGKLGLAMHLSRTHGIVTSERAAARRRWKKLEPHKVVALGSLEHREQQRQSVELHHAQSAQPEPSSINFCPECGAHILLYQKAAQFAAQQKK